MPSYLIAYDVSAPRRLRRVANCLEKRAVRLQKSLFAFDGSPHQLDALMREAAEFINHREDVLQAWCVERQEQNPRHHYGLNRATRSDAVIVGQAVQRSINAR